MLCTEEDMTDKNKKWRDFVLACAGDAGVRVHDAVALCAAHRPDTEPGTTVLTATHVLALDAVAAWLTCNLRQVCR